MRSRSRAARLAFVVISLAACDTGDPNEARRMPNPPPPEASAAFAQIGEIEVVMDGVAQPKLDAAKLEATAPDFVSEDRRAWKFTTLLGPAANGVGSKLAVTGEKGLVLELPRADEPASPIPVLVVSRRGDVMAAMVTEQDPFPPYHGRGGRLGRQGDPLPRIAGVTKIELTTKR